MKNEKGDLLTLNLGKSNWGRVGWANRTERKRGSPLKRGITWERL